MKKTFFSLVVITLLAIAACSLTLAVSVPTSTPISATPTPNDNSYISKAHGFRLQIPEGYRIEELPRRDGVLFALRLAP